MSAKKAKKAEKPSQAWEWSGNLLVAQEKPHDVVLRLHAGFKPAAADAKLVAAAPELLKALDELLDVLDDEPEDGDSFAVGVHWRKSFLRATFKAKDARSKARGGK